MGYDVLTPDPVSEDEITTGRNAMVRLFSPESFRDYITSDPITRDNFKHNGTVVLQPSSCYLEITAINDSWQLKMTHPYDQEGRFTYISRGCVLEVPCKVAREQENEEQLFRIFEVRDSFGQLEALAYPIAMESTYETPIYYHEWKKVTAKQLADSLSSLNPKYKVTTDWLMKNDLQEQINEVNDRLRQLQVGGNVNLLKRPEIDAQLLVDAGWTEAGTGIATVYSSTFSNEQETKFYNFTPIVDDPVTGEFKTVFGPARLTRYAEAVIAGSRQDDYACQIGGPFNSLDAALDAADEIHELHDELHDLTKNHPNVLRSIYASETNLQGLIQGDSDFTFVGAFNTEVAYDNFTYIVNRKLGDKNSAKRNKIFYAVNMAGIEITENTTDLITRIYPMSAEGLRYTDDDGNYSYVDAANINDYPIVYARVIKYDNIKTYEEHEKDEKVPQNSLQKITQSCKAAVKATVRTNSKVYLTKAHDGDWDYSQFLKDKFVDDGNQAYLENFSWQYDGEGYYYGDGKGHYLRDAWVEDAPNKHYWVNGEGYWDPGYDDTVSTWTEHKEGTSIWYGATRPDGSAGAWAQNQWIKYGGKWHWFDKGGWLVENTTGGDPEKAKNYRNPHDPMFECDEFKRRWALPYGYIFYSYTDAVEYMKDMALLDVNMEYDTLQDRIDASTDVNELSPDEMKAAKQDIWNLFADAIQQGFKWCEDTTIAEWDWRQTTAVGGGDEFNYLKNYKWHRDAAKNKWWYGCKDQDGKIHKATSAWVEESRSKHYWVDKDGWWDPTYDDSTEWDWQTSETTGGEWYGSTTNTQNYAANQWIYDTSYGKWYWLDENGWYVKANPRWWFGSLTGSQHEDFVHFAWHKIGNHWWWFDKDGYVEDDLAYVDSYDWHTDETNTKKKWYGDDDGHQFKGCWVEETSGKHYKLDADGYYIEEDDDDSSSDDSGDDSTDENTDEVTTATDTTDDSDDDDDGSKDDVLHNMDNEEWSWHSEPIDGHERWWYGRYYQNAKGEEDTSRKQYYAEDQWMYITENKAWFKFVGIYAVAAWISDDNWEWRKDEIGWYYGDGHNTFMENQWGKIDKKWYFFDSQGYADPYTDDFTSSKTQSDVSATLETNRDGINRTTDDAGVGSETTVASYNEKREGVQAWIQKDFIQIVRDVVNEQYARLKSELNKTLKAQAEKDIVNYCYPTLTIEVDMALLDKMDGYEQYKFLHELYLGDHVQVYYPQYGYDVALDERIIGCTFDVLTQKMSNLTIGSPKDVIYRRTAALTAKTGVVIEGADTDVLETGYEGGQGTKYAEASRRVQYIEG